MELAIEALNRTGLWLAERLEPLPVDLVMAMLTALAVWVWVENLRAWVREKRAQRQKREAVEKEN